MKEKSGQNCRNKKVSQRNPCDKLSQIPTIECVFGVQFLGEITTVLFFSMALACNRNYLHDMEQLLPWLHRTKEWDLNYQLLLAPSTGKKHSEYMQQLTLKLYIHFYDYQYYKKCKPLP